MKKVRIGLGVGILVTVGALALFGCNKQEETGGQENKVEQEENTTVNFEVKDAEYASDDLKGKSYHSVNENKDVSVKDLVFPYIDCDTEDAKATNDEIKKLYEKYEDMFKETLNSGDEEEQNEYYAAKYDKVVSGDMMSIIISTEVGGAGDTSDLYYGFNFDTKTGKRLSYEEVYKNAGFTEDNIDTKVEESIKKFFGEIKDSDCPEGMTVQKYIDLNKEKYEQLKKDNKLGYFLNKDKKLNVVFEVTDKPFDGGGNSYEEFVIE